MPDKKDFQLSYYQQRIGELSVQYEAALADLKSEAEVQIVALITEIQRLKEKYEPEDVSAEDAGSAEETSTAKDSK